MIMKKIFKLTLVSFAVLTAVSFSACTDEYEYDGGSTGNKTGYYLVQPDNAELSFKASDEKTFPLAVHRADSTAAGTVTLTSSNADFSVPSTVDFAAGEGTKTVNVTFTAGMGSHDVTFSVPQEQAFVAGAYSVAYTVVVLGHQYLATLTSGALASLFNYSSPVEDVEIDQIGEGTYRIMNPYAPLFSDTDVFNFDITVNENGVISCPLQAAFSYSSTGDFKFADANVYYTSKGSPLSDASNPSYFDEENGVFTICGYFQYGTSLYGFYNEVYTITGEKE